MTRGSLLSSPPFSVLAEKSVLSAILLEPELIDQVRVIISGSGSFFREQYAQLYATMLRLRDEEGSFDAARLSEALHQTEIIKNVEVKRFLEELQRGPAVKREAGLEHARQVQEKAMLRRLIDTVSDILYEASRTSESFPVLLERARRRLDELAESQ